MGVICHGPSVNFEKDITKVNIRRIFLEKKTLEKIIKIQRNYKRHKSKHHLLSLRKELKEKIFNELDEKKLIDLNKILESKSEQYYNKLISSKKIRPFEELIKMYKNTQKELDLINNNSFIFPFNVEISEEKIYKGSWSFNKNFHGYGVLYEFNYEKKKDSKTEGIFNEGSLNGLGRIFLSNEEMLIGDFIFNKLNGSGQYFRNDGSIYKGSFFDGLPQGNGQEIFKNESRFTGFYLAGKKKHGKFLWKNGNFYQGDFHDDLFHGYGVYKWGNERTYEGNWKEGKMDGKGKLVLVDGSYYDGEFVKGKKSGKGLYVWNKEKYYDGEWKNDKQNGYGVYYKNGTKIKGFWISGKLISNYNKLNNNNIMYISPDNKHMRNIDEDKNMRTTEYKLKAMISDGSSPHNNMKSESKNSNDKKNQLKRNNTHIYISKKINNKHLSNIKKNINFIDYKTIKKDNNIKVNKMNGENNENINKNLDENADENIIEDIDNTIKNDE